METLFLKLLNMSITASWLILAVILLRALFKNGPKYLRCLMWAMVGIRLLCPFSFESVLSLIPSAETVPQEILYSVEPEIHSGISSFNNVVNPVITQVFTPDPTNSINPLQTITSVASIIWILGMAAMLIYAFVGYRRIHIKVREAIELKDNIWICDCISTPFILGVFRPRIFLPSTINESDIEYIIAHEKAHLKRRDHWWKPLGFVLLSLYWFNPLVWLAYILLCRDIEFACDEKVLKEKGLEIKKPYSNALINCSLPCRIATAYPLAFSEDGVKGRVKAVLNYKKPRLWVVIA
ncbi:MAG: transcriptional regulator, partial [Fastidiosipila sp.]|nr:transcriptional regulator [Fastidiosipila sp.]